MIRALARAAFVASLAFSGGCGAGMGGGPAAGGAESELIGAPAPDFSLEPVGGGAPIGPKSFSGKVVLVDFWATWCAPCKDSFPAYQRLVDKYSGELVVLGVSVDESSEGVAAFGSATGAKFPLVWDEGQGAAGAYKPPAMPTCYGLDRHGIVQFVHQGFRTGDESAIDQRIASLL